MVSYLFTLFVAVLAGGPQPSQIEWKSTRKLSWEDFKASPDSTSSNAALTSSSINVEFDYDDSVMTYSIKCFFDKNKSWVKVRNEDILAHEQGHFDIAELHARKLNKALKTYRFNPKTVSADVNSIYDSIIGLHHKVQSDYDRDTDFSRNKQKQAQWILRIEDELVQLRTFSNYRKKTTR